MSRRVQCPRCAVALVVNGNVRSCPTCKGNWLDHAQVTRLLDAKLELIDDPRESIRCPVCRMSMDPKKLYGVAIDRCTKHGIWFDRDERDAICKLATSNLGGSSKGDGVLEIVGGVIEILGELLSAF